jgi:hypothetical protein
VREALTMVRMLRALASAPFGDGKRLIRTQG